MGWCFFAGMWVERCVGGWDYSISLEFVAVGERWYDVHVIGCTEVEFG